MSNPEKPHQALSRCSFVLFLMLCLLPVYSYAQNNRVTLSVKQATLRLVFSQIEKQTTYRVSSLDADLDNRADITMNVKKANINTVMARCLKGRSLTYRIVNSNLIVVTRKDAPQAQPKKVVPVSTDQPNITVKGQVSDENGEPIIGAGILIKGTSKGTISDDKGRFTITAPKGSVLTISYIGYFQQNVKVHGSAPLFVTLRENANTLDEVVAVGYADQKKIDMTGSVETLDMNKVMENRPITNATQALEGAVAGLQVSGANFEPGQEKIDFAVRGVGTLNNSAPLVIIDGAEGDLADINPQDIDNISVLKDAASAAIYGSRAANGVILVTTKKGVAGRVRVSYNGYVTFQSINKILTPVSNYADYMELINEGQENSGMGARFTQDRIDEWRNATDRQLYPNQDWVDALFDTGVSTGHTVSVNGGSKAMRLFASVGYSDKDGVIENAGATQYTGTMNLDADVNKWLSLGLHVNASSETSEPGHFALSTVWALAGSSTPGMLFRSADGRLCIGSNSQENSSANWNNPLRQLHSVDGYTRYSSLRPRLSFTIKPLKGLKIAGSYTLDFLNRDAKNKPLFPEAWDLQANQNVATVGRTRVYNSCRRQHHYTNDLTVTYENSLFNHRFKYKAMVGVSNEEYRTEDYDVKKYDLIDPSLDVINAAYGDVGASGTSTEWAMRSFFGRINLNWRKRYLMELNMRADGSSRFAKGHRWGYFPSISVGWRINQEKFMKGALGGKLSNLKLRFSYGKLGNNAVGNYDYQSVYTSGFANDYVLNNTFVIGLAQTRIPNPHLTWESTQVTNVGLDFGFFKNKLTGTIEYFNKFTKNILISLPQPAVHGSASLPKTNSAQVTNNGLEVTLNWRDHIGNFTYGVKSNFTYVKNNVTKFKGKDLGGMSLNGAYAVWEGHSINALYTLVVDRIIQTDEDLAIVQKMIDNAPTDANGKKRNPFAAFGTPQKGDLLYKGSVRAARQSYAFHVRRLFTGADEDQRGRLCLRVQRSASLAAYHLHDGHQDDC